MQSGKKSRILLVDDEPQVRDLLGKALSERRYEVETAANWNEAHAKLLKNEFDVLLIDLHLPGVEGDHYARVIRRTSIGKDMIILLFSSEDPDILAEKASRSGADGFISKLDGAPAFMSQLDRHLAGRPATRG